MKNTRHSFAVNRLPGLVAATFIAASAAFYGGRAQAQASISGLYPNGTNMFQPSATLSFVANSAAGITNVTVHLTVTSLYTQQSFIRNLSIGNGLTISGSATAENVSLTLASNTLYAATIQIQDANGASANQTFSFDTVTPSYTWEAEDWNYTSNGVSGLFIDNPQTNGYAGLLTTDGVDAHNANGPSPYRIGGDAGGGGLATEAITPPESNYKRLQYIGTGKTDYDVGYTDGTDFGAYSRKFPQGTYNLFVRASGGNGPKTEAGDITFTGTAVVTSPGSTPYKYGIKGSGWQNFDFMPVTDNGGNLIQVTFDGSTNTVTVTQNQANDNMSFFMLMPVNTNIVASTVTITNVTPDGSALYNQAGTFSFNAFSPTAPVSPNNIIVTVTATNLWLAGSATTPALTITGPSTNLLVSFPTTSNTIYSVFIQITDAAGNPVSTTASFDTIIPTYWFEAEDFNYGGGQYVHDDPQTNGYFGLDGAADIDYHVAGQHGGDYNRVGLTTESLNEKLRPQYAPGNGKQDYDVGFNDGQNWGNYTRNYPPGTYNIYVRASNGTGNTSADSGSISLVTGDPTQPNQALLQLGKFSVPAIAWSTYSWVPVKDSGGNLARFTGGSVETLRMTIDGGDCNENFFLLTPVDPTSTLQPYLDSFLPDGTAIFQPSNTFSFAAHSQPGAPTGNINVKLNGADVSSGLVFSGNANLRTVSYSIKPNAFYTAVVTLTDANGVVKTTNSFATFSSTNYQFEAEDYDHDSGGFSDTLDNSYLNVGSVAGVDNVQADLNANPFNYRLNSNPNYAPSTTTSGDAARDQLVNAGRTDYNIGFFGRGSWANYTRHYPAGTYNIIGRFAEGNSATEDTMSILTSGYSTGTQTTNFLGTFPIAAKGWGTWEWAPLTDAQGNPVKVTLDGTRTTLQLEGTPVQGHDEANVNFFMLVATTPSPLLTATMTAGKIHIAFPTQSGFTYQLQYKNNLTDVGWTPVGAAVTGDGTAKFVEDPATQGNRFYHLQVQ